MKQAKALLVSLFFSHNVAAFFLVFGGELRGDKERGKGSSSGGIG